MTTSSEEEIDCDNRKVIDQAVQKRQSSDSVSPNMNLTSTSMKYTIEKSEYVYFSPGKDAPKTVDLRTIGARWNTNRIQYESPKSSIDFDTSQAKEFPSRNIDDNDLNENYAADKEDNLINRRQRSFKHTRRPIDNTTVNGNDLSDSLCDRDKGVLGSQQSPDSPPYIKRNIREDSAPLYSAPLEASNDIDHILNEGSLENVVINKDCQTETERKFPQQPFSQSNRKWYPSSGFYPSSYDTIGSGYGSLDYSSEDQSNDTPTINNTIDSRESKPSHAYNIFKGKARRSSSTSTTLTNHLPLVPEMKNEEDNHIAETNSLLQSTPITKDTLQRKTKRKRYSRQVVISRHLEETRGEKQQAHCRDLIFAFLFYIQMLFLVYLGFRFGPQAFSYARDYEGVSVETGMVVFTYRNVMILTFGSGILSLGISMVCFYIITVSTSSLVQITLFTTMSSALLGSFIGLMTSPQSLIPVICLVLFGTTVAYTFTVYDHISFVTAQFNLALSAIKDNASMIFLAFLIQMMALTIIMFYFFTIIGMYHYFLHDSDEFTENYGLYVWIGMGISFIWTFQVLMNVLKATTSGVIENWWFFHPYENPGSSIDIMVQTFARTIFLSFGSICFGSLFIGPAQFLRHAAIYIRPNKEEAALQAFVLLQELIVSFIDLICVKFNNWAFSYVGIYGYDYIEAGVMVQKLFHKRGWTEIVSNNLLENVLYALSVVVGGLVGLVALILEKATNARLFSFYNPSFDAFIIGFIVGVVQSNILFCVITSTVDTIMICFAGSPDEFETRNPLKCLEFRSAWKEVWPGTIDFVDVSIHEGYSRRTSLGRTNSHMGQNGPAHLLGSSRSNLDDIFV